MARTKKQNNKLLLLAIVLGVVWYMGGFDNFFSFGEAPQTCTMDLENKTCSLTTVLPAERAFSSYNLNLQVEKIPENEYGIFKPAALLDSKGPFREEDERRDEDEWESVYLYKIDGSADVASFLVKAEATASIRLDGTNDARSKIYVNGVETDYTPNNIVVCTRDRRSECVDRHGEGTFMIQSWRDDGEYDYTIREDVRLADYSSTEKSYESLSADDVRIDNEPTPQVLSVAGTSENARLPIRNDVFLITTGYEREDGAKGAISGPTNVQYAVKEFVPVNELSYGINNNLFEVKYGETEGEMQTLDVAEQLNDYCGRNNGNVAECEIELLFTTTTGGKITVLEENEVLKIAKVSEEVPVEEDPESETPWLLIIAGVGAVGLFIALKRWKK